MHTNYQSVNDIVNEICNKYIDKKYLRLSFWEDDAETASLRLSLDTDNRWIPSNTSVFKLWELHLLEESPKDYIKDAQKLKTRLKRRLKSRVITSDLRWR